MPSDADDHSGRDHDRAAGAPRLAGRRAVVTGASTGIGRAIALAFAAEGADVLITYRTGEEDARAVADLASRTGRRAAIHQLDLADERSIAELAGEAQRALGGVDVWVNNAGADILTGSAAGRSVVEKLDELLQVDLRGTVLASWEAVRLMRSQPAGGVIVNMSWDHVIAGMAGENPEMFSAVKGGVLAFSKSLARSAAPAVRVNVLAPGWIETEFGAGADRRYHRHVIDATPLGRWGTPDDVARAAVFLASADSAFMTGQTLFVGGGVVM